MNLLKNIFIIFFLAASAVFAQSANDALATSKAQSFTVNDLEPNIAQAYLSQNAQLAELRKQILEEQISEILFADEAKFRKTTPEKMLEAQMLRVPKPTEVQIKAVYDANKDKVGGKTLEEIRPQIVDFLMREPRQKVINSFVSTLKVKYKVALAKDVNAAGIKPTDTLATVNGKPITYQQFDQNSKMQIGDYRGNVYDAVVDSLEQVILSSLIVAESRKQNLAPESFIAREITDKFREYTDEERENLQSALQAKLFKDYDVKILLKEPEAFVQKISIDDDPAMGPVNAPVTVVMFSDFQCPACAATHPVLKKVLDEYGDKVRFVVRDFPLAQVHKNAVKAAQAAGAANAQGKFFEYIELLYKNQESLDNASLKRFGAEIGLDQAKFAADLDSGKFAAEIQKDVADGMSYKVSSTPTIFINGIKVRRLSADAFRRAIDKALAK